MSTSIFAGRRLAAPASALILVVASLVGALPAGAQTRALILGEEFIRTEIPESVVALTEILAAQGVVADVLNPLPGDDVGDLAPYECVFDLRVDYALDPVIEVRLQAHVEAGRGLYLAGEHSVFAFRNDTLAGFVEIQGGGAVTVSPFGTPSGAPRDIIEAVNPAHALATDCNSITEVDYDGIDNGQFLTLGNGTWVSGSPTSGAMAAWGEGQLIAAPDARIVVALDVNWLATGPSGTLDFHVLDRTLPTQNRPLAENMTQWLCVRDASCGTSGCEPRNHGFWHRACLGWDAIQPGRNGGGNGPGPSPQTEGFPDTIGTQADGAMAAHGIGSCEALDEGPFSDARLAALRELATLHLNLKSQLLSRSCKVELHPVNDTDDLDVGDALAEMERLLALGDDDSAHDARWIGEHVNNGEALIRR